jgi:hypothetical protein
VWKLDEFVGTIDGLWTNSQSKEYQYFHEHLHEFLFRISEFQLHYCDSGRYVKSHAHTPLLYLFKIIINYY